MASNNNIALQRIIRASPEKVYRAFTEAGALAAWLPPYGFYCTPHEMDLKVGGKYRMSFTNFTSGKPQFFGGTYLEVVPNEHLKYEDKIDDPMFPESMITSVWFSKCIGGTELKVTHENIPAAIPAPMCYMGWQDSLDKLMKLVEPNIPDA